MLGSSEQGTSEQTSRRRMLPAVATSGAVVMTAATVFYAYEQGFMSFVTPERANLFSLLAYGYLAAMTIGAALVVQGIRRLLTERTVRLRAQGFSPLSPSWILPYVFSVGRYKKYFVASSLVYGTFYAFLTSIIVYQPTVDFVEAYGASFPSALIAPCCGPPLYTPIVTVYLANHLGLLLIPLTIILLVVVSVLVGANSALAVFAFDNRVKGSGRSWVGGLGAAVGLFTGCPTCAGLFFANFLGGSGAVSFAVLLSYYQPVFVALSIPALLATPFLISRSLSRTIAGGCVMIHREKSDQS